MASSSRSSNKELKIKYHRLLNKHRQRYHLLLKKYTALESKFAVVEDAGTPEQVIRDARNFLTEEHVLFLESQMFLKNRPGTGNRFSKKFMRLMLEYYKRSPAGYRFLRTIFTIPSTKTVQKWLNRPLYIKNEEDGDTLITSKPMSEPGSDNESEGSAHPELTRSGSGKPPKQYNKSRGRRQSSNLDDSDMEEGSSEEYDTEEESDMDDMDAEEELMKELADPTPKAPDHGNKESTEQDIGMTWAEPWDTVAME